MTEATSGTWLTSRTGPIRFHFQQKLFLSLYHPKTEKGCAIVFVPISRLDFQQELEKAKTLMPESIHECEVKIVGPPSLLNGVDGYLRDLKIPLTSSVCRDQPEFEIIFYPDSGRVRLAKIHDHPMPDQSKTNPEKIRVLVVDDSVTIRKLLAHIFSQDPGIEVVATAEKPSEVEPLILKHHPHILTLDIHMPEMNGVELLKILHPKYLIPTIMISSISIDEGPLVLEALESGAIDYIQKPSMEVLTAVGPYIIEKLKTAAHARIHPNRPLIPTNLNAPQESSDLDQNLVIAIGSSTGGTEALREILTQLPAHIPPILIVQHIPAVFSLAFANRMNDLCVFDVKEATDGDAVLPGQVLVAPGGKQMKVIRSGGALKIQIDDSPPVNRHKPSIDILFDSIAKEIKDQAIGIILTGMGSDGAKGLKRMKEAGARTIAQDEDSCVVFGMPKEAIRFGAVDEVVNLYKISEKLVNWMTTKRKRGAA